MITKSAKATSAHQAILRVPFCHFRTSHMRRTLEHAHRSAGFNGIFVVEPAKLRGAPGDRKIARLRTSQKMTRHFALGLRARTHRVAVR